MAKYEVTVTEVGGGCGGCLGGLLLFGGFLWLGNAIMDDGGLWVMDILTNPLVAVPLIIFIGIPLLIFIVMFILSIKK